jgi:hypothetical protein
MLRTQRFTASKTLKASLVFRTIAVAFTTKPALPLQQKEPNPPLAAPVSHTQQRRAISRSLHVRGLALGGGLYLGPFKSSIQYLEALMKALTFLSRGHLQRRVERGLSSAQSVVETVDSAKKCLEFTQFARYQRFSSIPILLSLLMLWPW